MKTTIKDRSDEELNRTIAEWEGWKFVPEHDVSFITPAGHAMPEGWTDPEGEPYSIPPNYCRDLNACHAAENKWCDQSLEEELKYYPALTSVTVPDNSPTRATSRQRAEALVAVIEQQKGQP